MATKDARIDAYIAKAADFAQPILSRLRKLIHASCPAVTETIKWNAPFYEYKGILVATPAFKQHCALIFWKGQLLFKEFPGQSDQRKKLRRITSIEQLPDDKTLRAYLRKAVELNEAGVKNPGRAKPKAKKALPMPDDFLAALQKNKKALSAFEGFSPSCQREYIEWIIEAKREETRARRIKTAVEWIGKGKARNWKYE